MCIQNHIIYICKHTKQLPIEQCPMPLPRTCNSANIAHALYTPHACQSCRRDIASRWRLELQTEAMEREEERKKVADEERMQWDERFREKVLGQKRREEERMRSEEVEERTLREIEREIECELERMEEERRVLVLKMGMRKERMVVVVDEKGEVEEVKPDGRRMLRRKERGGKTQSLWSAFDAGCGSGSEEDGEQIADGLGIFYR